MCHCILISKWHWLQKPKFKLSLAEVVSTFWSASDTDMKNLCLGVYTFWLVCLYLWVSPLFHQGVSAFWSASDIDFKNLSSNFHWRGSCLHHLISKWHTDCKNLSLGVSAFWSGCLHFGCCSFLIRVFHCLISKWHWLQKPKFQLSLGGCLHLLISKWQWLQKPKFGHLHLLIRVSPPLGASAFWSGSLHLWVCLLFDQGLSTLWSASDTDFKNLNPNFHQGELSPSFDQQATLTSKT